MAAVKNFFMTFESIGIGFHTQITPQFIRIPNHSQPVEDGEPYYIHTPVSPCR